MPAQVMKRLFTVREYYQMAAAGILSEDDRVELLEGEIVEMAPIGSRHAACVDRLNRLFSLQQRARQAIVRVQSPIHLGVYSEPQPDLTLLRTRADFYARTHPQPQEVLLVVEVAETSVDYDREVKVPLYARAGLVEVWLVDLAAESVEVYRHPSPQGYEETERFQRGERIVLQDLDDLALTVDDILG